MQVYSWVDQLVAYGVQKNLIEEEDCIYVRNALLEKLNLTAYESMGVLSDSPIDHIEVLKNLVDYGYEKGLIESPHPPFSDLFDTALMATMVPRPSEVNRVFRAKYAVNPEEATDYFYALSRSSHYIRTDRVAKNMLWDVETEYGAFNITINLSKPEKDPKAIAMAKNQQSSSYPKCLLCYENVGYQGNVNHPARQNHRVIPMGLNNENWYFQYSPYVYFNEHSIVFKREHEPMKISEQTYRRLLDFVDVLPHYFIGSNADLPIVGGSMLSHDHYQAGRYEFPMELAEETQEYNIKGFESIEVHDVHWPLSVLRLRGENKEQLVALSTHITEVWKQYSDESVGIKAYTDGEPHNTITPIARRRGKAYEMDLVLRNNRTNDAYPDGIFHPHPEIHPVKKENIGLIEVMGLAVLPSRLKDEMLFMEEALIQRKPVDAFGMDASLGKFRNIYAEMLELYNGGNDSPRGIIKGVIGRILSGDWSIREFSKEMLKGWMQSNVS